MTGTDLVDLITMWEDVHLLAPAVVGPLHSIPSQIEERSSSLTPSG